MVPLATLPTSSQPRMLPTLTFYFIFFAFLVFIVFICRWICQSTKTVPRGPSCCHSILHKNTTEAERSSLSWKASPLFAQTKALPSFSQGEIGTGAWPLQVGCATFWLGFVALQWMTRNDRNDGRSPLHLVDCALKTDMICRLSSLGATPLLYP